MKYRIALFVLGCLAALTTAASAVESPPIWLRTFGNSGAAVSKLQGPSGLAFDAFGRLLIADGAKRRLVGFTQAGAYVFEYPITIVSGFSPRGVATASDGSLYACSNGSPYVMRVEPLPGSWTAGGTRGPSYGLAGDGSDHLFGTFINTAVLREWNALDGSVVNEWQLPVGSAPAGVWVADGLVYVACSGDHRVRVYGPGGLVREWGGFGTAPGSFNTPQGLTVDGDAVYVADSGNHRIQKFTRDGVYLTSWGSLGSTAGKFDTPAGVIVSPNGEIFVADFSNNRIQVFGPAPVPVARTTWGAVKRLGGR